jgi:hypothetical protein
MSTAKRKESKLDEWEEAEGLLPERWGEVWGVDDEVEDSVEATYLNVFRVGTRREKKQGT